MEEIVTKLATPKLILAKDSIFPVVKNALGNRLSEVPQTGFSCAGTIQGEGKLVGTSALFVRLAGCNLRCIWKLQDGSYSRCDTPYASFNTDETIEMEVDEVAAWVKANLGAIKYVVISGGEPLLQQASLAKLCQKLKLEMGVHITVETNGTIFSADVSKWVDLFSISPKLSNSVPDIDKLKAYSLESHEGYFYEASHRRNINVLQRYVDFKNQREKDLQLKFVVGQESDETEIKEQYLSVLKDYKQDDIMLMPLGANTHEVTKTQSMVLQMAIKNGWRYSPRIHLDLFGSKIGV